MNYRNFGKDNICVSECGLGCWQFSGDWAVDLEENTAYDILDTVMKSDINFFDTADVYGDGRSEKILGNYFKKVKNECFIATKYGRSSDVYPDNYTKDSLKKSVLNSLSRLRVDTIDLLQLHCIPTEILRDGDIFNHLEEIKKEGLIKNYGASVETVEEGLLCLRCDGLASLQVIFNIFRQKLIDELFPQAEKNQVGIIVRLPLASGLLSGKFTSDTIFRDSDHRNYNRDGQMFNVGETFSGLVFEKGVSLANEIKKIYMDYKSRENVNISMSQFSQRWILDHSAVTTIIPGASSTEQAIENSKVSDLSPLPKNVHSALKDFYTNNVQNFIRGAY